MVHAAHHPSHGQARGSKGRSAARLGKDQGMHRVGFLVEVEREERGSVGFEVRGDVLDRLVEVVAVVERVDAEHGVGPVHEPGHECLARHGETGFSGVEIAEVERSIAIRKRLHRHDASAFEIAGAQLAARTNVHDHLTGELVGSKPEVFPEPRAVDRELRRSAPLVRGVVCELLILRGPGPGFDRRLMLRRGVRLRITTHQRDAARPDPSHAPDEKPRDDGLQTLAAH